MKKCRNIFLTMFLSILVIYTFIVKENNFIKSGVIIFVTLIIINLYFYKKIVTYIRKSYLEIINLSLYTISIGLLVFSNKDFNKFLIKCKILFNNFSFNNIYYYTIMVSTVFLTVLILINLFKDFNKIRKNKSQNHQDEVTLLSFREKEKKKLKEIIKDKKITSILIEAEMGNGKTTLINSLIKDFKNNEGCEVIYFKLPLVKSYEELEKNLLLELQKILVKFDLNNKFINNLLSNVSTLKLGCIEINLGKKESIWNTLQELQSTLMKINKKILIILDDIEREENLEKIYKSILFLGELSEYFRKTNVTILLLSQYDYLELAFNKVLENKKTNSNSQENSVYLDKYYKYRFRLNEPTIYDLNDDDLRLIIEDFSYSSSSYINDISEKTKHFFFNLIIRNIHSFFIAINATFNDKYLIKDNIFKEFEINTSTEELYKKFKQINLKINIRLLEKSIKEILTLYILYKINPLTFSTLSFAILGKNFECSIKNSIVNALSMEEKEKLKLKELFKNISQNIGTKYLEREIKRGYFYEWNSLLTAYNKGEIIIENIDKNAKIIENIIENKENSSEVISPLLYQDYIFNLIKGNRKKVEIALENQLILSKTLLIKIINTLSEPLSFSVIALANMRNILFSREFSTEMANNNSLGECEVDENIISLFDLKLSKEEFENYKKEQEMFLKKISIFNFTLEDTKSIKDSLEKDNLKILEGIENYN